MILGDVVRLNAQLFPEKEAIVCGDRRITFREYNERVNRLVNALNARGFSKGDRIGMIGSNCPEFMDFYGAAEKGGFVAVPLNYRLAQDEIGYIAADSEVKVIFAESPYVQKVEKLAGTQTLFTIRDNNCAFEDYDDLLVNASPEEPAVQIDPNDPVYMIYTGGTTGKPKGVLLTHFGQIANAQANLIDIGVQQDDTLLTVMPLFHIGGKNFANIHMHRGCTNVLIPTFDAEKVLSAIAQEKVRCLLLAPTMIKMILDHLNGRPIDTGGIRYIYYSSAPMPVALLREAIDVFGQVFMQFYGLTESGPSATILQPRDHKVNGSKKEQDRLASAGQPMILTEVQVVREDNSVAQTGEVGEVRIKNNMLMKGYWKNEQATAETLRDGWIYSGDYGVFDEDHYLFIVGRKKDLIISGGENIYPREIEEVIAGHQAVREVAVVGVPDPKWGEVVKAVVVLNEGCSVLEEELINYCKEHLASYKKPRSVEFWSELPKSSLGKILKNKIRDEYWQVQ